MNTKALFSFILLLYLPYNLVAQQSKTIHDKLLAPRQTNQQPDIQADQLWPKFYGGNKWTYGEDVDEHYDKGFIVSGNLIDYNSYKKMPIILKTDIKVVYGLSL